MLNIGQVVYDYTNKRVLIFAGFEMLQNQKTGKCNSYTGFILKDGTFILLKNGEVVGDEQHEKFGYTNFCMDGKAFVGSFIKKCQCAGNFFGIIDGEAAEVKVWAKEAIEEMEALIIEKGLNTEEVESGGGNHKRCHIGPIVKYEPKMTISMPNRA